MGYQDTDLWKLFEEKNSSSNKSEIKNGVKEVCQYGIDLSKTIRDTFNTYTLHDETHICNVMNLMLDILGSHKKKLTLEETMMLIMSACCHDIGMSIDEEEKNYLRSGCDLMSEYLDSHPDDYNKAYIDNEKTNPDITDEIIQHYVRTNHHKRVREQLEKVEWPQALGSLMSVDELIAVCQSHGEDAEEIRKLQRFTTKLDLYLCAVLLRLGDILDFDATRAPNTLYNYINLAHLDGVENEKSRLEWDKHKSSRGFSFDYDEQIHLLYRAECYMIQVEQAIESYLDWIDDELISCDKLVRYMETRWRDLLIPIKVERKIEAKGYISGEYKLTLDQERVLDLLVGREIYSDPAIFVRELIQNAIDAVRTREKFDKALPHDWKPQITIRTWIDDEGYSWFRIEDNGIGMTEKTIKDFFLKVGHSYYNSQQFNMDRHRNEVDLNYKPISRFGIGILSCFMGDTKNNRVEITTKHFKEDGVRYPAYRLSIQGINGYYYLANEEKHRTSAPIMPDFTKTEQRFISEPGTIIAVRTNIYQSKGYHTFKDIIDKYVVYPEVPIHYEGEGGTCDYKTEQEFIEEIHNLIPRNSENKYNPIERILISEEEFQKLQNKYPEIIWKERPSIAIYCVPLDYFSDSDLIKGGMLLVKAEGEGVWEDENIEDFKPTIKLYARKSHLTGAFYVTVRPCIMDIEKYTMLKERVYPEITEYLHKSGIDISKNDNYSFQQTTLPFGLNSIPGVRDSELRVFLVVNSSFDCNFVVGKLEEYAWYKSVMETHFNRLDMADWDDGEYINVHNGILIDNSDLLQLELGSISRTILLLKDEFCPQLNLSRNTLNGLPFEASIHLNIIRDRIRYVLKNELGIWGRFFSWNSQKSAQEYIDVMEKLSFPELHFKTNCGLLKREEIESKLGEKIYVKINDNNFLHLAILMKYFDLKIDLSKKNDVMIIIYRKGEIEEFDKLLSFPPALILPATSNSEERLNYRINGYYINEAISYNENNRFSKWLINNQSILKEKTPGIYQQLINCMLFPEKFMENINSMLKHLREIHQLGIEIVDDLMDRDFIEVEVEE